MKTLKNIKKLTSVVIMLVIIICVANISLADKITYKDNWGKQGITIEKQSNTGIELTYSINTFYLDTIIIDGEQMITVGLPGHFLPNDEGAPNLPGSGRYIAIPQGAIAKINIVSMKTETIKNIDIAPAPRIPLETDDGPLHYEKNANIYSKNEFYPAEPFKLSEITQIRGVDAVIFGITPFQYNPVTKELKIYRDIKIEITFEGGTGIMGRDRMRNRWWEPILQDVFLNYSSLPKVDFSNHYRNNEEYDYVIITPNNPEFVEWANVIKDFRTKQGIKTGITKLEDIPGGNTPEAIEAYVNGIYNGSTNLPAAILLLGDYGEDPSNRIISHEYSDPPVINNAYMVSDNYYADVVNNNNDGLPEIVFARITARDSVELEVMVNKFIDYENNPPTSDHFYKHPITAMGWQTERWFQICSETLNGFFEYRLGKEPVRENAIYIGSPFRIWSSNQNTNLVVDYFGPDGLRYIPAEPDHLLDWGGNATRINNDINNGAFMIQHRDHGSETEWATPNYQITDIDGLSNMDMPTFVFSINCFTGRFNYEPECLAEKFHRHQDGGALGVIAASSQSFSFVNDTYAWGLYDNMWPEFMDFTSPKESRGKLPAFASVAGKFFLEGSNWPSNDYKKYVTYFLFHHFGDAFTTIYTEMPQELSISHDPVLISGNEIFTVSADEGSLICLSVNGEIIGVHEGTGEPYDFHIQPQTPSTIVDIVITKQNYFRYEKQIQVIPSDVSYVHFYSLQINDATGNANLLMDYNESILLSLEMKNYGNVNARNVTVTISSDDSYIEITDNTAVYVYIAAHDILNVVDGFAFNVSENIPDKHMVHFDVIATDGIDICNSEFEIEAHAPILELADFEISGDGIINTGETVSIAITIKNTGSSKASIVEGKLISNDPYITINTSQSSYGDIPAGSTTQQSFYVTASENTPACYPANFLFEIYADPGLTYIGSFDVVIGQIPVLIIDLDENINSGPYIQTSVENCGLDCEYSTSFPADLNNYASIFLCLGNAGHNHELSSDEGQQLADYLDDGGKLYMEGGETWFNDDPTNVHTMFNIVPEANGYGDLDIILGIEGTFTEGLDYDYIGENYWIDRISAISPAVLIFENDFPIYGCGVAYDEGNYKTIGVSFEFGGLDDGVSTKDELMGKYLEFFGLGQSNSDIQAINFNTGFQFSSTRITVENPDMLVILEPILGENLNFVKNSQGEMVIKIGPNWVNGIGDWITTEGYEFNMINPDILIIEGEKISYTTPIDLSEGFQFVSYLPDVSQNALTAFEDILDINLDYIRNSSGEIIRKIGPNWVNGIGDCYPGEGYLIKMFADDQLVYTVLEDSKRGSYNPKIMDHFTFEGGDPAEAVYTLYVSGLNIGDEVGIYDGDKLVGAGIINSGDALENSIPVFNILTKGQGYETGKEIKIMVWDSKDQVEYLASFNFIKEYPKAYFEKVFPSDDGQYSVINITNGELKMQEKEANEVYIYPNPATDVLNIVSESAIKSIKILNFTGQTMLESEVNDNNLRINTSAYQPGIYIIRVEISKDIISKKVTIK